MTDQENRRSAAVQASLDALLAGASMLQAMAAAEAVMADDEPAVLAGSSR